jgi:CubicO group peptidase (beta-lactamase class C family)
MKPLLKSVLRTNLAVMLSILIAGISELSIAQPVPDTLSKKIDAYIAGIMKQFPIPGLAIGIVKGDQVLYQHGYGIANSNGDPVTPQTYFTLESVTKTFTSLAIHQLARAGKIYLDAPVQTYIPEFRLADQQTSMKITVRYLFEHRSGISMLEGQASYLQSPKTTFKKAINNLAHYRPAYQPGINQEYSKWNYVLLL